MRSGSLLAFITAVLARDLRTRSCNNAPVDGLVGYGAGTTGGGGASGTTVSTCDALKSAVSKGGVIKVDGMLNGCGVVDVKGSTSIIGIGSNSGKFNMQGA
jgi:pectate lyase